MTQIALQTKISKALSALIGLPLSGAHRTLNLEMLEFGERGKRITGKGKEVDYGEYGLHIQCPWRISGPEGIIVGSEDRNYPEDESSDFDDFDPDGPSRCEAKIGTWINTHLNNPLKVERVEVDLLGGFTLFLEQGFVVETFPANSLQGEQSEYWRLFRPWEFDPHFVVTGHGLDT